MIIIGFPGIGKSSVARAYDGDTNTTGYIDLESSNFVKDDNWVKEYCNLAIDLDLQGYNVFVSSHKKEVKLTIDGKEVQLTDEQLKMLGVESNKRINPFETVVRFEDYYSVEKNNEVYAYMDTGSSVDNQLYDAANYFNDKSFAKQVSLHQFLYRKLLKFSYENKCADVEWNGRNNHWCIYYNPDDLKYCVAGFVSHKFDSVWFSSEDATKRAIKEVVEPFMKEHPEFVW